MICASSRDRRQTKNGPRVLGNIGLEQRNAQVWGQACSRSGRPISERPRRREESALPRRESCQQSRSAMSRLRPEQTAASGPKTCAQQRSYATFGHCGAGRAFPTCAPLARVPIKRRWIKPLASCLQPSVACERRAAGSPAAARRRLRVGRRRKPWPPARRQVNSLHGRLQQRAAGCGRTDGTRKGLSRDHDVLGRADTSRFSLYRDGLRRRVGAAAALCR
jgi:hypothetical protein